MWYCITLTSWWPRWRLKLPASRLFTQLFIQTQIKDNIKDPRHWPLCGKFTGTGEFSAQRASFAENVSIWWRHHGFEMPRGLCGVTLLLPLGLQSSTCPTSQDEVTLLVENRPLAASRCKLMGALPVFKAMLESNFKEGHSQKIVLPEKKYDHVKFVVDYITSGFMFPVTGMPCP